MNGFVYWGAIFLFAVVGTCVVWVLFGKLERTAAARKHTRLLGLFIRIVRACGIATFFTPALYGWFPIPLIAATVGWMTSSEMDRNMWNFFGPKIYFFCSGFIFLVTEIFVGAAGKHGNKVA